VQIHFIAFWYTIGLILLLFSLRLSAYKLITAAIDALTAKAVASSSEMPIF
jgi:hypothetical protein